MMARSNDPYEHSPPTPTTTMLPMALGLVALFAFSRMLAAASGLVAAKVTGGSWDAQQLGFLAASLIVGAGAVWGLSRFKPSTPKTAALTILLACVALDGLIGTGAIVKALLDTHSVWKPAGLSLGLLALNLLIAAVGIGSLAWLKPWRAWTRPSEPISPATRTANTLFGLKELGALVAMVVLFAGTFSKDHPFAIFSNGPIPLWVALVAGGCWLLARALRELWGKRVDEHERHALDFGRRVGLGLFFAVTPVWWVAGRAGLTPQPDAMILWLLLQIVTSIAWAWRRAS